MCAWVSVDSVPNMSEGIERRTLLGATWAAPVISFASAVPMAAASGALWVVSNVVVRYTQDFQSGGYRLWVNADVVSVAAQTVVRPFHIVPDAGDDWYWYFPTGRPSWPMSTSSDTLADVSATTLTIIDPEGTALGPFPIDRSWLPMGF